jgi:hypothetical protein
MQNKIALFLLALQFVFAGCAPRTVLVPESAPMRVGPDVKAFVYTSEGSQWVLSGNRVEIPEGWYLVPPSFVDALDEEVDREG